MRRVLILLGILILLAGLAWPWLVKSGIWRWFGRLPGDIRIEREGFSFFFPIMTMIVISVVLSLVLWLFRRQVDQGGSQEGGIGSFLSL